MDIFHRPDIAAGIFFDYLRDDDPISPDFLDTVVEGFPFLLAPISQVKGVSPGIISSPASEGHHDERAFVRALGGFADMVSSRTEYVAEWLHDGASAVGRGMSSVAHSASDTARVIGEEMDRRREGFMRQAEASFHFVASRLHPNRRSISVFPSWMKDLGEKTFDDDSLREDDKGRKTAPRGRAFGSPLTRWLGESQEATLPDEIGPMIHPTMNFTRKVFLATVHLYLLLLLIVSLPGSPNTRTKLVVRRKARRSNGKNDLRSLRNSTAAKEAKRIETNGDECQGGKIKKSLSYFL